MPCLPRLRRTVRLSHYRLPQCMTVWLMHCYCRVSYTRSRYNGRASRIIPGPSLCRRTPRETPGPLESMNVNPRVKERLARMPADISRTRHDNASSVATGVSFAAATVASNCIRDRLKPREICAIRGRRGTRLEKKEGIARDV